MECAMLQYRLPPYVFVGFLQDNCIWLDTRKDRFRGTNRSECQCLSTLIDGWPLDGNNDALGERSPEKLREVAESLARQGLLTKDFKRSKAVVKPCLQLPARSLSRESTGPTSVSRLHSLRFGFALLLTFGTFKLGSLRFALATLERRKAAHGRRLAASASDTNSLIEVFMRLRTASYTAKGKCLFDSLTLWHFLAASGIVVTFVIGISEAPFSAHSWVQQGNTVLNDDIEHVKGFEPVVVI